MGNETSFQSFPAHVHNLLTVLLAETHVVHTKIYPRYRSKRSISFARDDFSRWLAPHEAPTTDVILLGHSMGGLLSAEIVLMGSSSPSGPALKHRILGTVSFDVPFLGMHPGVVKSGLASMFRGTDETTDKHSDAISTGSSSDRIATLWSRPDPNYNPSFNNDVVLPLREGWRNAWHFIHKHSNTMSELTKATKQLVSSHLEFGGAMANYSELKMRYGRIRALEEDNEQMRRSVMTGQSQGSPPRVRFVNYYTASTGIVKRKARSPSPAPASSGNADDGLNGATDTSRSHPESLPSLSPRPSVEGSADGSAALYVPEDRGSEDEDWEEAAETLTIEDPQNELCSSTSDGSLTAMPFSTTSLATSSLPPPADLPNAPAPLDVSYIEDPRTRKLVEKEHARAMKIYEKAVKDRQKAIKDRAKSEAKQTSSAEKTRKQSERDLNKYERTQKQGEELRLEHERQRMEVEGRRLRGESEDAVADPPVSVPEPPESMSKASLQISSSTSADRSGSRTGGDRVEDVQPIQRYHKFCTLPPKDSRGERDRTWVRVYMQNVDAVGAHCGLFFVDERYERLVGDVASRIEAWVTEDIDFRIATDVD